jgi:hypothetical protein
VKKILTLLLALPLAAQAATGTIKLVWTFDTSATATCADGKTPTSACTPTGFEVQEKDKNGIWVVKSGVASDKRTFDVTGVTLGEVRCYRLRVNAAGTYSDPSPETCVTVPMLQPKTTQTVTATVTLVTP